MYPTRVINLLMMALSVTSVTGVAWLNNEQGHHEVKRQDDSTTIGLGGLTSANPLNPATTTEASSTTTDAPSSTSTTQQATSTSTRESTTSATTTRPTSTSTTTNPGPTTSTADTNAPTTTTATSATSTTSDGSGSGESTTSDSPTTTLAPSTSTFFTVITTTDSAGQTLVTSSSSVVISTPTPDAASTNKATGIDDGTKKTVIGVCVGVGGAIVLAAAGVLFWRLRSKRRNQEESEELVSYGDGFGGPGTAEKTEPSGSTAGRSPFQSTLESYHAPTQTNAASNF